MSKEYLNNRDIKNIEKADALLKGLPPYVRQFYNAKKGAKKELTRYAYVQDINAFLTYLAPIHHQDVKTFSFEILGRLTAQDIDEYKNVLQKRYADASVKRKLASLSTFFKYLVLAGYVRSNPAMIIDWPTEDRKEIVHLNNEQTARLLNGILRNDKQICYLTEDGELKQSSVEGRDAVKGNAKNKHVDYIVTDINETTRKRREKVRLRNFVITLLFLKTGIRVSELVSIDVDDINWHTTIIHVTGKGGKPRPVGIGEEILVKKMKEYLAGERKALTKKRPFEKALFVYTRGERISVSQVESMIKEMVQTYLADDDNVRHKDFSPHKLRSTCATRLLKETGNIKAVSDLLGHESIEITSRAYATIEAEENAKAMQAYDVYRPEE